MFKVFVYKNQYQDSVRLMSISREATKLDGVSKCLALLGTVSNKDVVARMLPYWESDIIPDLRAGKTVLVAAHGNSLRALVKHLDEIDDETISGLNIPTGIPLFYELDDDFKPVVKGGRYLDPEAAEAGQKAVAAQGKK